MKNDNEEIFELTEEHRCECAEDDNCGCTFPENVAAFNDTAGKTMTQESYNIKTEERFIKKDTVCYCDPKNCDCQISYEEHDNA